MTTALQSLSFEDARHLVEQHAKTVHPPKYESVGLLDSFGLVLAENITADRDFPPFRRAARDGYAVRAADLTQLPATLRVIGEIKAGVTAESLPSLNPGQAAVIMTGAPAPDGADAVVMVEHTSQQGDRVTINKGIEAGANIVPTGSEAKRGSQLLSAGMRLDYAAISVAASVGKSHLSVCPRPRVAILATGDEIVDIASLPGPTQLRNSNSYSLAAQVQQAGGQPVILPIAPDELNRLRELIVQGLECDLLLMAGGVSMGKYDLVEPVLAGLQAQFFFTSVKIQPGKPAVFGGIPFPEDASGHQVSKRYKYFFGLPGNPVSTMVTFELFARPMLEALSGQAPRKLAFLHAKLKTPIRKKPGLKRFLPAILSGEFENAEVELAHWLGSGDIAATALANCYIVIPPDRESIDAGEWVPILVR